MDIAMDIVTDTVMGTVMDAVMETANTTTTTTLFPPPTPIGRTELYCIATSLTIWVGIIWLLTTKNNQARKVVLGGDGDFKWNTLLKEHVTQPARGMSMGRLAAMRFFFAFCTSLVYVNSYVQNGLPDTLFLFRAFTGWSWALLGLYFLLAGIATVTSSEAEGKEPATGFHCFVWVGFQVMTVAAFFVDIVVYLVLMPATWAGAGFDVMINVYYLEINAFIMHHINAVFMVIEAYCNRMQFCRTHVLFAVVYGNMYIGFSWFNYYTTGYFLYFFLDWRDSSTWFVYLILCGAMYGFFLAIMRLLGPCTKRGVDDELLPRCRTQLELEVSALGS